MSLFAQCSESGREAKQSRHGQGENWLELNKVRGRKESSRTTFEWLCFSRRDKVGLPPMNSIWR